MKISETNFSELNDEEYKIFVINEFDSLKDQFSLLKQIYKTIQGKCKILKQKIITF